MDTRRWLALGAGLMALLVRSAAGAITVERVCADGARAGGWELLRVSGVPAGAEVGVRDARGGVMVMQQVVGSGVSGGSGGGMVLIPVPFLGPEGLSGGVWPVKVVVDGVESRASVNVGGAGDDGTFRVIVPEGEVGEEAVDWSRMSARPVSFVRVDEAELLAGQAVMLSGCDAVFVPARLVGRMGEGRRLALINAGLRLVVIGDTAPAGQLVFEAVGGRDWVCPAEGCAAPGVVEPGLARVEVPQVRASARVVAGALLVGPGAVMVLLVVRGLVRRRGVVLFVGGAVLAAGTVGAVVWLRAQDVGEVQVMRWTIEVGSRERTVGALAMMETVTRTQRVFEGDVAVEGGPGELLYPVAASARGYWGLEGRLELGQEGVTGGEGVGKGGGWGGWRLVLKGVGRGSGGGGGVVVVRRGMVAAGVLPALPEGEDARGRFSAMTHIDLGRGWWIEGGYVMRDGGAGAMGVPEVFTRWAGEQAGIGESLRAWYELRFAGDHTYFVWRDEGGFSVIDFGAGLTTETQRHGGRTETDDDGN